MHKVAIAIAALLFVIPFFWLPPGFVDLGGDGGRLYFIDPLAIVRYIYRQQNVFGASIYGLLPYAIYISILQKIIASPTYLIATEHGVQLSLAFYSFFLVVRELLSKSKRLHYALVEWSAVVAGIVYVGFIARAGWAISLEPQSQVFLNPLMFYILLRFCVTTHVRYLVYLILFSLVYSYNFGFSSAPQLVSFYPLAILFLIAYIRYIFQAPIPWARLSVASMFLAGLHAFHILPTIALVFDKDTFLHSYVFSASSQQNAGVNYFDAIRQELGKLSTVLFQSSLLVPLVAFLGFMKKRSKLLAVTGFFFALTFYLTTANITLLGVKIYRQLFYIPGFLMFRSFHDKWYYVFIFFYTLLFAISFFLLLQKRKRVASVAAGCLTIVSVLIGIAPFLRGSFYNTTLYQSRDVPVTFEIDPDLTEALSFIKKLPDDGNALTLPLTLPYYQVIYGRHGGAYVGVSMVRLIGDKKDFPGFWSFGQYQQPLITALQKNDIRQLQQILSLLNIRYIFRNTDPRVVDNFPKYPYYRFDMTTDIPTINSQGTYDQLLALFPLKNIYRKGFFQVQKFDDSVVRPSVYIPDIIYASRSAALTSDSFRSAYASEELCRELTMCMTQDTNIPPLEFKKTSQQDYEITLDIQNRKKPFVIVLGEEYHSSWTMTLDGLRDSEGIRHVVMNGYANGWIVNPSELAVSGKIRGTLHLGFQKYFLIGRVISVGMLIVLFLTYGRKK